jgi:hypothetical protein
MACKCLRRQQLPRRISFILQTVLFSVCQNTRSTFVSHGCISLLFAVHCSVLLLQPLHISHCAECFKQHCDRKRKQTSRLSAKGKRLGRRMKCDSAFPAFSSTKWNVRHPDMSRHVLTRIRSTPVVALCYVRKRSRLATECETQRIDLRYLRSLESSCCSNESFWKTTKLPIPHQKIQ